jgi:hypothetical protein
MRLEKAIKEPELPELSRIPGMLSPAEKHYLYRLTSHDFQGKGAVVEIGSWLGSSAAYLASGLKTKWEVPLHCFDRFQADAAEVEKARRQGVPLTMGQDTLPVFKKFLGDVYPHVIPVKTDVKNIQWNGGPIEILHLDAPKKIGELAPLWRMLGPKLIPGRSVVVLQDFVYPGAYAIPLVMGVLGDAFRVHAIPDPDKCTVSFRYKKETAFDQDLDIAHWSLTKVLDSWQRMKDQLATVEQKAYFNFGLAAYFYERGHVKKALEIAYENEGKLTSERIRSLQFNSRALIHLMKAPWWQKRWQMLTAGLWK